VARPVLGCIAVIPLKSFDVQKELWERAHERSIRLQYTTGKLIWRDLSSARSAT
jgi:hypothetical protein